jgi:branched-chain amino acid transport system substrate-binding protein
MVSGSVIGTRRVRVAAAVGALGLVIGAAAPVAVARDVSGVSGDPVKIGVVASLSGPAADIGEDQLTGLELAADELNAGDGILGQPVELVVKDDGGDPTKASQAMRELVDEEEVAIVFGPTLSSPTLAAAPTAMDAGVLEFSTSVAPELGDPTEYPYFFRASPVATLQASTFLDYIEASGWSKPGMLAVNNALGSTNVEAFTAVAEEAGIELAGAEYAESGATDVSPQITNLRDNGADVVLVLSTATPDQVAAVNARNSVGWDVPMLGFSTMANPLVAEAVGADGMENVYAGQQYVRLTGEPSEATAAFLDKLREVRGGDTLEHDAAQSGTGYDVLHMVAGAVNEVGELDADAVREYLETNIYEGVKSSLEYSAERHDGEGPDDLVFVVADSFDDGLYELAPNQE